MSDWIDVSVPLKNGMAHWPGNPPFVISRMLDLERGDPCTVSQVSLGVHTGTHMDAPAHFLRGGALMETMPFEATIGPARLIEIHDKIAIRVEELESHNIEAGERIIFKTLNSRRWWETDEFVEDFVYISQEAARWLAARKVKLVGVDYLSVGGFTKDGAETHSALLGAGIWIIEGLNLSGVEAGKYELICLPMKLMNAEGAPARAILRQEKS